MRPVLARSLRRLAAASAAVAVTFMACRDGTGPVPLRRVSLGLAPRFAVGGGSGAQPISRIRLSAWAVDVEGLKVGTSPLATRTYDVNPADTAWPVALSVPTTEGAATVVAEVELIHRPSSGGEVVEWAGRSGAITVAAGQTATRSDVAIGRGGLPNLAVTDVAIGSYPTVLFVGDSVDLTASLTPADLPGTKVYWGIATPTLASISPDGRLKGLVAGAARITATAGLAADTINITVAVRPSASSVTIDQGDGQTGPVGTVLPVSPRVLVRDAQGQPVANVPVTFAVTGGGGTIAAGTTGQTVTNASGLAGLSPWVLGQTAGTNTLTATVAGLPPVTFTATGTAGAASAIAVVSGNNQAGVAGATLAQPLVARVTDQFGNPIAGVSVNFATPNGGTLAPTTVVTNAQGQAQSTWTTAVGGGTTQTVTATATGIATPATFTATLTPPPNIVLAFVNGADKVSLGSSYSLNVTLPTPAPAGGVSITLASSNASVLGLSSTTVFVAQGQSSTSTIAIGNAEGAATITATATGYQAGTLVTGVELRIIAIQPTFNVPYGQTASLPITIPRAAPAGGVTITLVSSDVNKVAVNGASSGTATIPAGATTTSVTLNGVNPGPANIVATANLYTPDTVVATTAAALDLTSTSYSLNASFGTTATVRFTSNNTAIAAPSPGVTFTAVARDPSCLAIAGTTSIATGTVTTDLALSYPTANGATLPCTTQLVVTASQPGIAADSATVSVGAVPAITGNTNAQVGRGLERIFNVFLGTSNHPDLNVTLTSSDPSRLLLAQNNTTVGSGTLSLFVPAGNTTASYYVQMVDTATAPTVTVNATASGFSPATFTFVPVAPSVDLSIGTTTTSLSADYTFRAEIGAASTLNGMDSYQEIRPGGTPITITITSANTAVGTLVTTAQPGGAGSVTVQIGPNQYQSPSTVASGGVAFRPVGAGTVQVRASAPGVTTLNTGQQTVTVTSPVITSSGNQVGLGLMRQFSGFLSGGNVAGATVRIVSSDSSRVLLSTTNTGTGSGTIDVAVPANNTTFPYWVHVIEGTQTGTVPIQLTSNGYVAATPNVTVVQSAVELTSRLSTSTTLSADIPIGARIGTAFGTNSVNEYLPLRAGAAPLSVTLASDTPSVATFVDQGGVTGTPRTVTIQPGQYFSPTGATTAGGYSVRLVGAGASVMRVAATGFITPNSGIDTLVVSAPAITLSASSASVGSGLMVGRTGFLSVSTHGGATVTLTSSDPSLLLLAPTDTSVAAASITVTVPDGQSSFTYWAHGLEGKTGSATITASAPRFTGASTGATVVTPVVELYNVPTTLTTLAPNAFIQAWVGTPTSNNFSVNQQQPVRFGGNPVTVTYTSSVPTVAQLVSGTTTGAQASVVIPVGRYYTDPDVSVDPLSAGTTVLSPSAPGFVTATSTNTGNVTLTVRAPTINFQAGLTVGLGLQAPLSFTLETVAPAGGRTVTLTSSQPSSMLLAPDATTPGSASITVFVPAGSTSPTNGFYVQALEAQPATVTITASTPGYTDGTIPITLVQPSVQLSNVNPTYRASDANANISVYVGVGNGSFLIALQSIRVGGATRTFTIASSNPAVAQLVNSSGPVGGTATVQIAAGQNVSPTSLATGGVQLDPQSPGTTTVAVTSPGFTATSAATVNVTVQAGLVGALVGRAVTGSP